MLGAKKMREVEADLDAHKTYVLLAACSQWPIDDREKDGWIAGNSGVVDAHPGAVVE